MFTFKRAHTLKKKHTSQFWVGKFDTEARFSDFIDENPEYWSEENEGTEDLPLSKFISSQNETWCDHDFIEAGFRESTEEMKEKFKHYSYSDQWAKDVEKAAQSMGMESFNSFIMIGIDEPPKGDKYLQISNPCSYKSEGIDLIYVGEFSYIDD